MSARTDEARLIVRCVEGARTADGAAADRLEANVFRVASMILSHHPDEAERLRAASRRYFADRLHERLPAEDVIRNGWIASLPRLKAMLTTALHR